MLLVWRFGGWRAGLTVLAAFVAFALMGLWEQSVQTLALMLAAVILSLVIGVPIGIWAGRNARVHRTITPALDAMQIVPAFAYLMPVVILFSVGPAAAVICTMIYADPARRADHGARHPRRDGGHGRGVAGARRDADCRRCSRSSSRSRASSCCSPSTRRSCSRSRSS